MALSGPTSMPGSLTLSLLTTVVENDAACAAPAKARLASAQAATQWPRESFMGYPCLPLSARLPRPRPLRYSRMLLRFKSTTTVVLAVLVALPGAAGAAGVSSRTAQRALVHRLERYQGFHAAHADCRRHTAREQRCTWHGRRA